MVARGKSKVLVKKRKYFEEGQEEHTELLPGLPNDITVRLICTKLPWVTFHVLSSVSRVWLGAIRSGEIIETRVRSRTAETLALMECSTDTRRWAMALYSLRDKAVYPLSALPPFENKNFPLYSGCVAIGGKVYMLGAMADRVWALDVARQKKWQECASMRRVRNKFGCVVFEGKIFVFGGCSFRKDPIYSSEVYDPKLDTWTKIRPMKSVRMLFRTCIVGDEILVYSGFIYDANLFDGSWRRTQGSSDGIEAYNPAKDSWRTISTGDFGNQELLGGSKRDALFTAHGRLHCFSEMEIESIDLDKKSVKVLHTCSLKQSRPRGPFWPDAVLATNDGFLTKGDFPANSAVDRCRLYQSTELDMGKKRILLEEVECSPLVTFVEYSFLEPIQL